MKPYCKNCGAKVDETTEFCPDCGAKVENITIRCANCGQVIDRHAKFCNSCGHPIAKETNRYCPNCGSQLEDGQNFCRDCGTHLNVPAQKESFFEKHKTVLIAGGAIFLVIILLIGAASMISDSTEDVGTQRVEVGSTDFIIPGDYAIDPASIDVDYKYSSAVFSQGWSNDDGDLIYIATMTVPYGVDAEDVLSSQGDVHKSMMGYDGYYSEDDGIYNFAFETGGYVCVVSTTNPGTLDEITCLG